MKKMFSQKTALLVISVCCSLSFMSFSDKEKLYGKSNSIRIPKKSINVSGNNTALPTIGSSYAIVNALMRSVAPIMPEEIVSQALMSKAEYNSISNSNIVSIQKAQIQKFKKLG